MFLDKMKGYVIEKKDKKKGWIKSIVIKKVNKINKECLECIFIIVFRIFINRLNMVLFLFVYVVIKFGLEKVF